MPTSLVCHPAKDGAPGPHPTRVRGGSAPARTFLIRSGLSCGLEPRGTHSPRVASPRGPRRDSGPSSAASRQPQCATDLPSPSLSPDWGGHLCFRPRARAAQGGFVDATYDSGIILEQRGRTATLGSASSRVAIQAGLGRSRPKSYPGAAFFRQRFRPAITHAAPRRETGSGGVPHVTFAPQMRSCFIAQGS
jgi:hypothetical protein